MRKLYSIGLIRGYALADPGDSHWYWDPHRYPLSCWIYLPGKPNQPFVFGALVGCFILRLRHRGSG